MSYYHHLIKSADVPAYGPLTTAYSTATGITDVAKLTAFNTFETGLTTYGLTTKLISLYFFRSTSSTVCSYNFMNTALYQQSFSSGWTFTNTYAQGDGFSAYSDTGILPSSVLSLNSTSIGYSNIDTTIAYNGFPIGSTAGSRIEMFLDSGYPYFAINSGTETLATYTGFWGRFIISRNSSTNQSMYKNGVLINSATVTSTSLPTSNVFISARSISGNVPGNYNRSKFQDVFIGSGLSATEQGDLNTLLTTLQAAL